MDTMRVTKIAAGVLGAWLVLLLGKWAGEEVYRTASHGEQSYVIEVADSGGGEEEPEVPFEEVLAAADPESGAGVFRKCSACHRLEDGANATGPHLFDVVGREVDAVDGFNYSGALEQVADVWSPENLNAFLEDPAGYAPGTSMGFAGLRSVQERADVIAYLDSIGN